MLTLPVIQYALVHCTQLKVISIHPNWEAAKIEQRKTGTDGWTYVLEVHDGKVMW
jgi:hypothetical protein